MKKKMTALLLTAAMITSLSGCASKPAAAPETAAAAAAAPETAAAAAAAPETAAAASREADRSEADAGTESESAAESEAASDAEEADGKDFTTGTPWLCSMIRDTVTKDTPADPKDDYYLYANKDKLVSGELTDQKPEIGTLLDVQYKVDEDIKKMFTGGEPENHDARLVYDLYHLAIDWESRDALGVAPLKEITDTIEAISSVDELTAYFTEPVDGEPRRKLWRAFSLIDPVHSDRNILMATYFGLLRKDSAEYSDPTPDGEMDTGRFLDFAEYLLVRTGYSEEEAKQKIENCLKLEAMVAPTIPTREERSDPDFDASQNKYVSREELQKIAGNIPVLEDLEKAQGFPVQEEYMFPCLEFFVKLNELYTEENLPLMKDYLIVHTALSEAPQLDHECFSKERHMFDDIDGASGQTDEEYLLDMAGAQLHWAVGRLYSEKYLKQEDKDRISALVDEIIEAYHDVLDQADWISDETRKNAIDKLDAIDKRILYPDSWEDYDYEGLEFKSVEEGGTYYDAYANIQKFLQEQDVKNFTKPVDNRKWSGKPQEVNCSYHPLENSIYILGAFAQGGIYNSGMSDEELYAKLGTVIGHEISHAFDIRGSQYDKDGNQVDWWTAKDKEEFRSRNNKLIDYFNAIHPWEGQDLDGLRMAGEACADITGMKCMLGIAAKKPDFDYDAFFRAYADLWFAKMEPSGARFYVEEDVHPLKYLRVNVILQQFDEFLETYGVKEGDKMYLAPEDRIVIW